jgi:rhodanese-related sulfurtransferase
MKALTLFIIGLSIALTSCAQKQEGYQNISSDSLNEMLKDEHAILLDVRTPQEYNEGHIAGAVNIDYLNPHFSEGLDTLNKDLVYEVYCKSGGRSSLTSEIMVKKGFKNVYNLENGITEWQQKKLPVVKEK